MPSHPGLRHFKNGISNVSQWTGTEHKEMEKVFVGLVAIGVDERVVKSVQAIIDFVYYASLQSHTTQTLLALRHSLDEFHANKSVFIELGGRQQDHFNIPKVHSIEHYEECIVLFGSADGFNTESSERLHIDFAKNAYRASNRKHYIMQMTQWLERQEAVDRFTAYLNWARLQDAPSPSDFSESPEFEEEDLLITCPTACSFALTKCPPVDSRRTVASHIIDPSGHNAPRFLDALSTFFNQHHNSHFTPHDFDVFPLWKRLVFDLPSLPEVGS
ncbi:hypothetical protein H0H81_004151 [Sphagnurus paluster]|uniref:Uncharacterized protein n=1 Tax=Sphagnurus paluster TaxID=117069 RepID=A0A9P7GLC5_9AGAR|nr:hypothetical protein H0H81_004151 [Sphagnurus paluster]